MKKTILGTLLTFQIAFSPLAHADDDIVMTRDEQINALKDEIDLRQAAVDEVGTDLLDAQAVGFIDKVFVTLGALATAGVWFAPAPTLAARGFASGIWGATTGLFTYWVISDNKQIARLKQQTDVACSFITKEKALVKKLIHNPEATLSKAQQYAVLSSSVDLRRAAITDIENRIKQYQHIGLVDVAVIAGAVAVGTGVWFIPPAYLGMFGKQFATVLAGLYASAKTMGIVIGKAQIPRLKEQLEMAKDILSHDELRLLRFGESEPIMLSLAQEHVDVVGQ